MVKSLTYLVQLTYDKTYKGYVADVVNLYGCMSQGKTKGEALQNARRAIKAYMGALSKIKGRKTLKEIVNVPVSLAS